MEITKLKGVGSETAKKFEKCGITLVEQLFVIPPPQIAEILGIDNNSAHELFKKAREAYQKDDEDAKLFIDGLEADKEDNDIEKISTGTHALDKLFTGGIESGATTEIFGEYGCGKTQFCHTQAVRVQLPFTEGGLQGKCVWIDTEGTFEPKRIRSIAANLKLATENTLKNIIIAKAYNSADQYMILKEVEKLIVEDKSIKLIIVDSAIGLFRQDYMGRGMLSERQKYLDQFLTMCSNMANFHKIAIIWTNQVMINPGIFYGDPVTAVGGTILAHKSTYRVYFKKSGKFRIAKMVDSPKHAETEVMFGLSTSGVVDMDVAKKEADEHKKELAKQKTTAKAGKLDE